jgi:hypothetical protein
MKLLSKLSDFSQWLKWIPLAGVLLLLAWIWHSHRHHIFPPIGTYIAILTFLAIVITIWPPTELIEKIGWLLLFSTLSGCEIQNLYHDRKVHDEEQARILKEERDKFEEERNKFAALIAQGQTVLDGLKEVGGHVKDAGSFISGGNSYPSVFPGEVTQDDGTKQIGFYLQKRGNYPLYDLNVRIGRPYRVSPQENTIQVFGKKQSFAELNDAASHPIFFAPMPDSATTYYTAYMAARNGVWEEVFEIRMAGPTLTWRFVEYGGPNAQSPIKDPILDLADEKFPAASRHSNIYPLNALGLPYLSERNGAFLQMDLVEITATVQFGNKK